MAMSASQIEGAMTSPIAVPEKALLVIAHPGHELRLYGWLEATRPDVLILTDGSGRLGTSRLPSTQRIFAATGAHAGALFGQYTDQYLYRAFLTHDHAFFLDLAVRLATIVRAGGYAVVVADPLEGYNPVHDMCRVLVDAVVRRVSKANGQSLRTYDYTLIAPDRLATARDSVRLHLPDAVFRRKLLAVQAYQELSGEVDHIMQTEGAGAQAVETLRQLSGDGFTLAPSEDPPYYEVYGERQRAAGHYAAVIRYQEHFRPLAEMLVQWATHDASS